MTGEGLVRFTKADGRFLAASPGLGARQNTF